MTNEELQHLREALEAKQRELAGSLQNREDIVIEKVADPIDTIQATGERELAIRTMDRDTALLRQIRSALFRISSGTYGVCLHCEEDIAPRRLKILPYAAYCVNCQELLEKSQIRDTADDMFAEPA